jgi:hypothetical protein
MSDVTELFEGKITPQAFIAKEWSALTDLGAKLPANVQPAFNAGVADLQEMLSAVEGYAGTFTSAIVSSAADEFQAKVLNLLSAVTGGNVTSAAGQDALKSVTALLQGLIADAVASFQAANAPKGSATVPLTPPSAGD